MRILFLAHRLPYPPNKGDKIRSFRELAALSQHHEVDLFCFYDQSEDSQYFADVRRYCCELYAEKISWPRSRFQALLALAQARPFTPAVFHSSTMAGRIREALRARNYQLIFVFGSAMAAYVESASGIPRVLDMVDVDSDKWTQYACYAHPPASWIWSAEGRRLAESEKRWVRDFSLTLLCTHAEVEIFKRTVPDAKIEAFENRMDMNYFDPTLAEVTSEIRGWQPYIIFTGSMDYFPNVDAVAYFCRDVFPAIRAKVPNAQFVIAGRNPTRTVRKLARDAAVHLTGAVADMRPYLRGASAAVAPMRVARGVQNKILEAMAMNLPVAASRKSAMALPRSLTREVHVEDEPRALATFLIEKLRDATPQRTGTRGALLEYLGNLGWEKQLEAILLRAVQTHAQGHNDPSRVPPESSRPSVVRGESAKQERVLAPESKVSMQPLRPPERFPKAGQI